MIEGSEKEIKVEGLKETGTCPKCHQRSYEKETLVIGGKYGLSALGRGWQFDAFICNHCGYTEFYLKEHKQVLG